MLGAQQYFCSRSLRCAVQQSGASCFTEVSCAQDNFNLALQDGEIQLPVQQRTSSYLTFADTLHAAAKHWGTGVGMVLRQVCFVSCAQPSRAGPLLLELTHLC